MSVNKSGDDSTSETDSEDSRPVNLLKTLGVTVFVVGWSVFWGNLARLLYTQGDLLSSVFTLATLVVPAFAALIWYAAESHGFDVPIPYVDANVTGS